MIPQWQHDEFSRALWIDRGDLEAVARYADEKLERRLEAIMREAKYERIVLNYGAGIFQLNRDELDEVCRLVRERLGKRIDNFPESMVEE